MLIAGEKAKSGRAGGFISSKKLKRAQFTACSQREGSDITLVGRDVEFERIGSSLEGQRLRIQNMECRIPLLGVHQVENAATAYAALKASGIPITDEQIKTGLFQVQWRAALKWYAMNRRLF